IDYATSAVPEDESASTVPEDESAAAVSEDAPEQSGKLWEKYKGYVSSKNTEKSSMAPKEVGPSLSEGKTRRERPMENDEDDAIVQKFDRLLVRRMSPNCLSCDEDEWSEGLCLFRH
ncbi:hypothetical protein Tco_1001131, partial [Tanacetum coccineum]